jgi:hypothetical protein
MRTAIAFSEATAWDWPFVVGTVGVDPRTCPYPSDFDTDGFISPIDFLCAEGEAPCDPCGFYRISERFCPHSV